MRALDRDTALDVEEFSVSHDEENVHLRFEVLNHGDAKLYEFVKLYIENLYVGLQYLHLEPGDTSVVEFQASARTVDPDDDVVLTVDSREKGVLYSATLDEAMSGSNGASFDADREPDHVGSEVERLSTKEIPEARWRELEEEYEGLEGEEATEKKEVLQRLRKEYEALSKQDTQGESSDETRKEGRVSGERKVKERGRDSDIVEKKVRAFEEQREEQSKDTVVRSVVNRLFGNTSGDDESAEAVKTPEKDSASDPDNADEEDDASDEEMQGGGKSDVEQRPSDDVDRVATGIIGLDEKMQGGLVRGTMNLVTGKTGTGKTAFCANFLKGGAEKDEPGVYVTTEEREEDIRADIKSMFGWDFGAMEEEGLVEILSIKPIFPSKEIDNLNRLVRSYISNLLDEVMEAVEEIGAERVIIDSVSIIEMFIRDEYMARVALASLLNKLREADVTAVLTGTVPETSKGLSGGGIIEFLVDTVLLLEFVPVAEEHKRTITIRKMRRTDHRTEIFPFEITPSGIEVFDVQG